MERKPRDSANLAPITPVPHEMKTYLLTKGDKLWHLTKPVGGLWPQQTFSSKEEALSEAASFIISHGGGALHVYHEDGSFEEERIYESREIGPQ